MGAGRVSARQTLGLKPSATIPIDLDTTDNTQDGIFSNLGLVVPDCYAVDIMLNSELATDTVLAYVVFSESAPAEATHTFAKVKDNSLADIVAIPVCFVKAGANIGRMIQPDQFEMEENFKFQYVSLVVDADGDTNLNVIKGFVRLICSGATVSKRATFTTIIT